MGHHENRNTTASGHATVRFSEKLNSNFLSPMMGDRGNRGKGDVREETRIDNVSRG